MVDVLRDPEELETGYIHRLAGPEGARVLEIGCGDGRLTWRYAAVASSVCGIDTNASRLAAAVRARPASLAGKAQFVLARAEALPFSGRSFNLAILAWSL